MYIPNENASLLYLLQAPRTKNHYHNTTSQTVLCHKKSHEIRIKRSAKHGFCNHLIQSCPHMFSFLCSIWLCCLYISKGTLLSCIYATHQLILGNAFPKRCDIYGIYEIVHCYCKSQENGACRLCVKDYITRIVFFTY